MSGGRSAAAWDEFERVWGRLQRLLDEPGTVVLVEGERDRRSLRALGVAAPVHLVHHGHALAQVARTVASTASRVVVLTDWDSAGGQLARRLRELLADGQVSVDLDQRRRLATALRGEIVHVEGLFRWVRRRLEERNQTVAEWLASETPA